MWLKYALGLTPVLPFMFAEVYTVWLLVFTNA
jgi:hypothetical protein